MIRPRTRVAAALLLVMVSLQAPAPGSAREGRDKKQDDEKEEVDHLALGARLVADEHYDRALLVLKQIDPKDEKVDRTKLHFLLGTIYVKKDLHAQARDEFLASIKAGQQNQAIYLYLAQAHFQLGEYAKAVAALDKAPQVASENPGTFSMRAEAPA